MASGICPVPPPLPHSSDGSPEVVLRSCSSYTGYRPDQVVKISCLSVAGGWASIPDETHHWNWKSESRGTKTESAGAGPMIGEFCCDHYWFLLRIPVPSLVPVSVPFLGSLGCFFRLSFSVESYSTCFGHAACLVSLVGIAFCCLQPEIPTENLRRFEVSWFAPK